MVTLFYGRENLDKEAFLFDHLELEGRALIIVPDQFTLEMEQRLFDSLKVESIVDIEVISMSRLGYRLLSQLGGSKRTFIDKYGRHMVLSEIARKEKENLKVFRGLEQKDSFIDMVNNFISELKQYNCKAEDLAKIAKQVEEDSYVHKKLEDLHLIFSEYEDAISGKYTDSEDYIDLFLSKIHKSELIKGNNIWIYGFDSLSPKAISVIGQLMVTARSVNILMTYSHRGEKDEELFTLSEVVMNHLEREGENRNLRIAKVPIGDEYRIKNKEPQLEHIEKYLFALPYDKYQEKGQAVKLVEAANIYNEAESAAAYILSLVRDEGFRYRDIKLICNDQESRGYILRRIFREYGIDLFADENRDIMGNPIIQYVVSLLDVVVNKYRTSSIIGGLKSGFFNLTTEEIMELENYAIKYKVRGSMWKRPFHLGEYEYGVEGMNAIEKLREKAIKTFVDFEQIFKVEKNGQFIDRLYQFLYEEIHLPEKIKIYGEEQARAGRLDLADDTEQVWGSLIGILDQIKEILGETSFNRNTFLSMVKIGLSQVTVGVLPPSKDGLSMGTTQRSRTGRMRALVVVGANEGILPKEKTSEGLFGGDEKDLFKEKGMEIAKVDSVMALEERLGIYRTFSRPTERLYVSYSMADENGKSMKPSNIFLKLKEMFPQVKVERDVLNRESTLSLVNGNVSGMRHFTEAVQNICDGREIESHWKEALSWYKENRPEILEKIKKGVGFTNRQERLGKEVAKSLYRKGEDVDTSLSPSKVETFSRCPFSFFIGYGLKPKERRIFQIDPREIGDIYHYCLMKIAERLTVSDMEITDENSPWMTITEPQCRKLVETIVEEQASRYKEGILNLGEEEQYKKKRIIEICSKVCWILIEQVRAGKIENCGFEVGFKRGGSIEPIEMEINGEKVYIEGKIDRIDLLQGDRVKIIDYKTGNESFHRQEAESGYRLQLILYLEAALEKRRKPAGIFYFHIEEPMVDMTSKEVDEEELEKKIRNLFKMKGVMVDDPSVIQMIAGDFENYSEIVPIRKTKNGIVATGEGLLSDEEFKEMEETVMKKVKEICKDLIEGKIEIHPMKTDYTSACQYCQYKGICRFDTIFEGCKYHIV